MSENRVSQILLEAVKVQLREVEKIRAKVHEGSDYEPTLHVALDLFNAIVVAFLKSDLSEVAVGLTKGRDWGHPHAVLEVVTGDGFKFRVPVSVIKADRELTEEIKNKMAKIQIVGSQIRSLANPAQPMTWEELDNIHRMDGGWKLTYELKNLVDETLGARVYLHQFREIGLMLEELQVLQGALEVNYRLAARRAIEGFFYPYDLLLLNKEFRAIYRKEQEKWVAERRAGRVACEVRIKAGDTRWGRYSYGIDVIAPDGEEFAVVNSGSVSRPRWYWSLGTWERWLPGGNERESSSSKSLVPNVKAPNVDHYVEVDVERLPDEDGQWRWKIYLPNKYWKVRGGSTAFHDRAIEKKAVISCTK